MGFGGKSLRPGIRCGEDINLSLEPQGLSKYASPTGCPLRAPPESWSESRARGCCVQLLIVHVPPIKCDDSARSLACHRLPLRSRSVCVALRHPCAKSLIRQAEHRFLVSPARCHSGKLLPQIHQNIRTSNCDAYAERVQARVVRRYLCRAFLTSITAGQIAFNSSREVCFMLSATADSADSATLLASVTTGATYTLIAAREQLIVLHSHSEHGLSVFQRQSLSAIAC